MNSSVINGIRSLVQHCVCKGKTSTLFNLLMCSWGLVTLFTSEEFKKDPGYASAAHFAYFIPYTIVAMLVEYCILKKPCRKNQHIDTSANDQYLSLESAGDVVEAPLNAPSTFASSSPTYFLRRNNTPPIKFFDNAKKLPIISEEEEVALTSFSAQNV